MKGLWAGLLAAGAATLAVMGAVTAQGAESAVPLKLRFGGDASTTRVVLELDQAASADVVSDGSDGHVVLTFSHIQVGGEMDGQGKGVVKTWSLDKAAVGKVRLSLDLGRHGKIRRRFLLPPSDGVSIYRYVMDIDADGAAPSQPQLQPVAQPVSAPAAPLAKTKPVKVRPILTPDIDVDPEAPAAAPAPLKTTLIDPGPVTALKRSDLKASARPAAPAAKKVIVIDAGHGGHDPGALGGRSHEKDVTLAAAKVLRTRLERAGRFKVVLTRDSDVYVPLEDRVKIARHANADLFISLHADSGGDPKVRGATVYTLSDHGVDRTAKSVFNGGFINVELPGKDMSVKQIILDLTQRTTRNRSGAFAETLLEKISTKTPLLRRSHRDAGYMVLLAPDVPAVLLEMGFITSPEDEANLTDPDRREVLMGAVGDAIEAYFAQPVQVAAQ